MIGRKNALNFLRPEQGRQEYMVSSPNCRHETGSALPPARNRRQPGLIAGTAGCFLWRKDRSLCYGEGHDQ
ncbi:MAG: hypothetical protein D3904_08320 [Candidatus Electrothrix sp. EH2]|nr:hypothetical protein [Candidatus Electrothrix sp. EH2]